NPDSPSSPASPASSFPSSSSEPTVGTDAFLPLVLIALSLIFVFIWQLSNAGKQRGNFRAAQDQLEGAYRNTVPQLDQKMQQSRAVQAKLEALVTDVLKLANDGDPDAQ